MDDDFGRAHRGRSIGDFEDLVSHDGGAEPSLHVRKLWNPVTYRCAFCGESFVSRAMIRRHLARHAAEREDVEKRAA